MLYRLVMASTAVHPIDVPIPEQGVVGGESPLPRNVLDLDDLPALGLAELKASLSLQGLNQKSVYQGFEAGAQINGIFRLSGIRRKGQDQEQDYRPDLACLYSRPRNWKAYSLTD